MARLRAPDGCPWDREQDTRSLLPYLLEESCEFIDAAQAGNIPHMAEELGDVLLQVVFHSQVASEQNQFAIEDVVHGISEKMVRRHPHVFAEAEAETSSDVLRQWEKIKATEGGSHAGVQSAMDKVARSLPSLARAQEMQRRAAKLGFDWSDVAPVLDKVREEFDELAVEGEALSKAHALPDDAKAAAMSEAADKAEDELGDLLFAMVNLARHWGLNAELALNRASAKFERRFRQVEALAAGRDMKTMGLEALDGLWDQVKATEKRAIKAGSDC